MSDIQHFDRLRPIERRILTMKEEGKPVADIANRIKRSPEFVERIIEWTDIPRAGSRRETLLSPLQSRVLALAADGEDHETIAKRFKKSERFIRQVEGLAHYRKGLKLMNGAATDARSALQSRA